VGRLSDMALTLKYPDELPTSDCVRTVIIKEFDPANVGASPTTWVVGEYDHSESAFVRQIVHAMLNHLFRDPEVNGTRPLVELDVQVIKSTLERVLATMR